MKEGGCKRTLPGVEIDFNNQSHLMLYVETELEHGMESGRDKTGVGLGVFTVSQVVEVEGQVELAFLAPMYASGQVIGFPGIVCNLR